MHMEDILETLRTKRDALKEELDTVDAEIARIETCSTDTDFEKFLRANTTVRAEPATIQTRSWQSIS